MKHNGELTTEAALKIRLEKAIQRLSAQGGDTVEVRALKLALSAGTEQTTLENGHKETNHNPIAAKNILASFSSDEKLKFFTHQYDSAVGEFNYDEFLERAWKAFNKVVYKQKNQLHESTYNRLNGFVKGEFFFTYEYKIEMAWGNTSLADWCKANPNIYPDKYPLPQETKFPIKNNRLIKYPFFSDVIKRFKFDIQLRTEDSSQTLDRIIKNLFNEAGLTTDFKLNIKDAEFDSVELFIDTVQLKYALKRLFGWISLHKDRSTHIKVTLISKDDVYELDISHINSYISWDVYAEKRNGLHGDINEVRKILQSICDWQMHISTKDGNRFKFPYLTRDVPINRVVQPVELTDWIGEKDVTYKLILYK
ncbi:hypothetical protein [Spirosoma jeollabukense]